MEGDQGENQCSSILDKFGKFLEAQQPQMVRVNGLIIVNAILAVILVGIGAYGPRYRHRAFIRFFFEGATTLFVPIFSYVVSNGSSISSTLDQLQDTLVPTGLQWSPMVSNGLQCDADDHLVLILLWAGLVQIVGINTCAIVAADDREGRNIGLPMVLLAQAVFTFYLAAYFVVQTDPWSMVLLAVFPLIFVRMVSKCYAFQMARRSFALGQSPRLIVGYMGQLQEERQHVGPTMEHLPPPPLIVMGEETQQVEKDPHGYRFKQMVNNKLVTIDKVWHLDDVLLSPTPRIKDVCFSFALFKMLRCRFAGYTIAEAGFIKTRDFFRHELLENNDPERVFRVIEDELSFLHDYYYSSLPISYSKSSLPIISMITSLLTIFYCLCMEVLLVPNYRYFRYSGQISCSCYGRDIDIGNMLFEAVPIGLLLVLVMLAETRNIVSHICSNWTKVALICRYVVTNDTRRKKWVGCVLRCTCKLMKCWDDRMNQCSVLVLHPRQSSAVLIMRLLHLPDEKKKVNVPAMVKAAIVDAVRSRNGIQINDAVFSLRGLQDGDNFLWACHGKGTADTILVWHIATSILEVRHLGPRPPASDHKIVAIHLSRYCAYLVADVPELLPDDDSWCKSLYKAVKKDSMHVLSDGVAASTATAAYEKLVALLSAKSKHEVLKNGVKLGKQLAELTGGEDTAWRVLVEFWLEMMLYVAPSDNLNGHAEAIARGGELITLMWALLMHDGTATRPSTVAGSAANVIV